MTEDEIRQHVNRWVSVLSTLAEKRDWRTLRSPANDAAFSAISRSTPSSELRQDPAVRVAVRRMASALCQSLGWDLAGSRSIDGYTRDQRYSGRADSERLKRCGQVLAAFGMQDEWNSIQSFAQLLLSKGAQLRPSDRDYWGSAPDFRHQHVENGAAAARRSPPAEISVERFRKEHERDFNRALQELRTGEKQSDWIWYLFPQVAGLGRSAQSDKYSLYSTAEAQAFFLDPQLGGNYRQLLAAVNSQLQQGKTLLALLRKEVDVRKFISSLTLFTTVCEPIERLRPALATAGEILKGHGPCSATGPIVQGWTAHTTIRLSRRDGGWKDERRLIRDLSLHGWDLTGVVADKEQLHYTLELGEGRPSVWEYDVNGEGALAPQPQEAALNGPVPNLELIGAFRDRYYVRYYFRTRRNEAPKRWTNKVDLIRAGSASQAENIARERHEQSGWRFVAAVQADDGWLAYLKQQAEPAQP